MTNKIISLVQRSRDIFLSLLFPPRCLVCDELLEPEEMKKGIHLACENKLYPIFGAVCMHCGRPLGDSVREYCYECNHKESKYTQGKELYLYKGVIKNTMYRFKYSNKREYAKTFAREAVQKYGVWMQQRGIEAIVPVPMYLPKQRHRGYNQAESFAREISRLTGIPVCTSYVYRVEDTTPQKELDPNQRKNNLKNAFQPGKNVVQYRCVMVVDDIYTTGSTAEAVAAELIKKGAHQVYLLTVCIGGEM